MRSMLLIAYDSGDLSDEDFLVLYNSYQSRNPEFPFAIYGRFSLDSLAEAECLILSGVLNITVESIAFR